MGIAKEFFEKLQHISENEPLAAVFLEKYLHYSDGLTFETILNEYAKYFCELSDHDKEKLSNIFWEQVKFFGTPIIEKDLQDDKQCNVYFLFPKDKLSSSIEKPENKKDLYLQGDFHSYGSTDGRQGLKELPDTGIMWHKDSMPKEAIVVYSYIEVEPSHRGIKQKPELPPFFTSDEGFTPCKTTTPEFPEIPQSTCKDEYSTHIFPFPGFDSGERIFRVSAISNHAHIEGQPVDWPGLLCPGLSLNTNHFVYHATFYSNKKTGDLQTSDAPVSKKYHMDLHFSNGYFLSLMAVPSFNGNKLDTNKLGEQPYLIKNEEGKYKIWGCTEGTWQLTDIDLTEAEIKSINLPPTWEPNQTVFVSVTDAAFNKLNKGHQPDLPYAGFSRDIHVFKPASDQIDDIIVINDGIPYLMTGIIDRFEKMVDEEKLSPNTAFVFIHTLPGLKETLSPEEVKKYNEDPSVNLRGMGARLIDYKHGINSYIDFIANKLFKQVKINVPDDPNHRLMIGSSLSGTASIDIGSHAELFGGVIAQSPSPDNREILSKRPKETLSGKNMHVSCGAFEHPDYAGANANVEYAKELSLKLKPTIPFHEGNHGHQFIPWNEELSQSLPKVLNAMHSVKVAKNPSITSHSIFTHTQSSGATVKETEKKLVKRLRGV